jgi:hypothetical protein
MLDADALDIGRAIARNRFAREEARETAKVLCRKLEVGQSFSVAVPTTHPARRDTVNAVNGVAWGILGTGRFTLVQSPGLVTVTRVERKERRPQPASVGKSQGAPNA